MSSDSADMKAAPVDGDELSRLSKPGGQIVREELSIFDRVSNRLQADAQGQPEQIENLDAQLIELRDAIAEAKEEDVPSLIDQMHQVAALSRKRGQGRAIPLDPKNPYFGHLRLREANTGRCRDVLIGRHTLLDGGDGLSIVDWRNAPVSRLYYRYEEEDEYEEDFDDRTIEGKIIVRRSVAINDGVLRRIAAPQGTYVRGRSEIWQEAVGSARPSLEGGSGTAIRVRRDQLGVHGDDSQLRADKHLQEITALIDRQQFELITQPESGIVLIQGGAGSGKTTVALHRVAYLAFQDPRRFTPSRMLIVVYNAGLVEYIRHVLPSLGVEGVPVTTYRNWTRHLISKVKLRVDTQKVSSPPDVVSRFKKHPLLLRMMEELLVEQFDELRSQLDERLGSKPDAPEVVGNWEKLKHLPPSVRIERMIEWLTKGHGNRLDTKTRNTAATVFRHAKEQFTDVVSDWLELNTSSDRIRSAIARYAAGEFTATEIDSIVRWCAEKVELDVDPEDLEDQEGEVEESSVAIDPEDAAILLRLLQLKDGGIFIGNKRFEYEHVVMDEAQDLSPLEVRVLLDCVSDGRSVTIAGDRAQKMVFDNGFVDWPQLLADAGLPHVAIQPLKITYRSTREVMEFSRHVLGPLHDPADQLIARDGAPVGFFEFSDTGESVAFLGDALRGLMQREPSASVALITRYPQQADIYYDALRVAEVPKLRRVRREDFSFSPGIDITDVRQVKGLEFDYVVLLDPTRQNYPDHVQSRHLMHIAATRAAYQLWLVCSGEHSPLIPQDLIAERI